MRKLFTFLFAALMSVGTMFADGTKIGDLYYNLDAGNQTAEVTYQEEASFTNYSYLTAVNIPESVEYNSVTYTVTSIGNIAFAFCSGLTSIEIPNSVTSIGESAFYSCTGLTSITIPNSVISIGQAAFYECPGLTSMVVSSENTNYDSRDNCNAIIETSSNTLIAGCQNTIIPNSVTSIKENAFIYCKGLTSITIPSSVTNIGADAFFDCTNITDVYCYADPNNLTWNDSYWDDFKDDGSTVCHVYAYHLAAYQEKFTGKVNVTFDGDLPIIPNVDPQNAGVYYCTFFDSANKYELPTGVEAYVAAISGDALTLTKIADAGQTIPADNAVILKSTVASFILSTSDAEAVTFSATNDLQGSDTQIATPANCYVLSCENNLVGFYQYNAANLNPHKAYVIYAPNPQSPAPRRMRFIFDATTDVENVQGNVQSTKVLRDGQLIIIRNGVEYNANGMMVK